MNKATMNIMELVSLCDMVEQGSANLAYVHTNDFYTGQVFLKN